MMDHVAGPENDGQKLLQNTAPENDGPGHFKACEVTRLPICCF